MVSVAEDAGARSSFRFRPRSVLAGTRVAVRNDQYQSILQLLPVRRVLFCGRRARIGPRRAEGGGRSPLVVIEWYATARVSGPWPPLGMGMQQGWCLRWCRGADGRPLSENIVLCDRVRASSRYRREEEVEVIRRRGEAEDEERERAAKTTTKVAAW